MSDTDEYWAAIEDPQEFCEAAYKKFQSPMAGPYASYQRNINLAYSTYYGTMPPFAYSNNTTLSSAQVQSTGDQGNIKTLKVNYARSHLNARHNLICLPELTWTCTPVNSDAQSLADASRGADILEFQYKEGPYAEQSIAVALKANIFGEAFLFTYWDKNAGEVVADPNGLGLTQQEEFDENGEPLPMQQLREGDIKSLVVQTWNLTRDMSAATYEESNWYSARVWTSKWEVIAAYPKFRTQILALGTQQASGWQPGATSLANNLGDRIAVEYFFHKRTAAVPEGRQSIMLSPQLIVDDGPLEEAYAAHLPIHRFAMGELDGLPYGYTDFWEIMGNQQMADDCHTSITTNLVTYAKTIIAAEKGTDIAPDQLANGPTMLYYTKNSKLPEALNFAVVPKDSYQYINLLIQGQRQQMGLNDITMGQPETAQMNAQAFALLASMSIQQNSQAQKSWVKFVKSIGKSILAIYRLKATTKRKLAITGKQGMSLMKHDSFDKQDFQNVDDVYVEIGNPLAQTQSGRLEIAQLNIQQGFIQVPEQLAETIQSGTVKPLTQGLRQELLCAAEENEMILNGETPQALFYDDHILHIKEHKQTTYSGQGRMNPATITAAATHIKQHMDLLKSMDPQTAQMLGQQALAPMAPPPGAPPGGPGEVNAPPGPAVQSDGAPPLTQQPGLRDAAAIPKIRMPSDPATGQPFNSEGVHL